jgi:hypothetical protein
MTDNPYIGLYLFGAGATLYASIVLTLDWYGRRRQQRRK